MSVKSIKISNLLSYNSLLINEIKDLNCIIGKNNSGKSNLLKLLRFFYQKIEGRKVLPPSLNSNYSSFGSITIEYDLSRIKSIVTSSRSKKTDFTKHIYNTFFNEDRHKDLIFPGQKEFFSDSIKLTLFVNKDESIKWSTSDYKKIKLIGYLFPFFDIETRHIDLYDWNKLWLLVSRLKSFKVEKLKTDELIEFIDSRISENSLGYKDYISKIQEITKTTKYSYREKVLNFVRIGIKGQTFNIDGQDLGTQSDGTNSFEFINIFLNLLISLTRREFISPIVFIDEPETGLHPKACEELMLRLHDNFTSFSKTSTERQKGRYATPYPKILFSTHSPHITKITLKMFKERQQVLHFTKDAHNNTCFSYMRSQFSDEKFINTFSDNESRLFFGNFILFVEGETEIEAFSNRKLIKKFDFLDKVDIYKTSSTVNLFNLNPNINNTSIPFLYVFDMDKAFDFKFSNKKAIINLKKNGELFSFKPTQLKEEIKKYERGFSDEYKQIARSLKEIESFDNASFDYNKISHFFTDSSQLVIDKLTLAVSTYSSKKNIIFLSTTFEGCLINEYSSSLFFKWLSHEHQIDVSSIINRLATSSAFSEKILISFLRIIFNGKSEILTKFGQIESKEKSSNRYTHHAARRVLKITERAFLKYGDKTDKTSGWVTRFLNFAIEEIENSEPDEGFERKFSVYFPELYSILNKLRT
ncbi:retron Eco8 family effector endonuclease [Pantoea agglomerans]|jgi:predicted ATP-dependent endonuclease of OLD family|uniref:retron Eco8 family effector endonuclease n=1 Tax=Enterobacter agglomerans TaxID=549 RepID=UPI0007E56A59|nr:retron Eco8 family effector endonuclease [Pantoea agglomerans]NEG87241.1 AAA family ATPase [Pantoea agglomerans]NEH09551.1 AAA family ATPase [Pantoea agglomerans]WHU89293.1 retron Eco8 family effector endonuclease [Pantoea agglomerans pv. gypsophilae]